MSTGIGVTGKTGNVHGLGKGQTLKFALRQASHVLIVVLV